MAKRPPLPDLSREEILGLSYDKLIAMLRRYGIEIDGPMLRDLSDNAFARIGVAIESGVEPDAALWAGIDRKVERAMDDALRKLLKGAVRDARANEIYQAGGLEQEAVWVATMTNTCDSCVKLHGQVRTLAEWDRLGLPGHPGLICNGNCNCQLVPVGPGEKEIYLEFEGLT